MKRVVSALVATLAATVMLPTIASAADIKIGVTRTPLTSPICPAGVKPANCSIVLTQVTAFETLRDRVANPTVVKHSGVIASFSVGLAASSITDAFVKVLDSRYGGAPEVQLTVLRPTGTAANPTYRVAAQSADFNIQSQFGTVAEIPLVAPLPVVPGEILALTVPTWAPVLSFQLNTSAFSYRQSRRQTQAVNAKGVATGPFSCNNAAGANLAQASIGELSDYVCNYRGTRVEYSALEVTTPAGLSSSLRRRDRKATKR